MGDKNELKPCPFCGGQASFVRLFWPDPHKVRCDRCECTAGGSAFKNDGYNAYKWNSRATATQPADAELAEELDCVASELATYQSDNAATVSRAAAALRARQPAQAVAVPEVWIAHDGGKCPLPAGVLVETRWRNGREFAAEDCRPDGEAWSWPPSSTDADNIVAYRLAASKGGAE